MFKRSLQINKRKKIITIQNSVCNLNCLIVNKSIFKKGTQKCSRCTGMFDTVAFMRKSTANSMAFIFVTCNQCATSQKINRMIRKLKRHLDNDYTYQEYKTFCVENLRQQQF
jgi:hypothetical protein